jgi:hypothetical protein
MMRNWIILILLLFLPPVIAVSVPLRAQQSQGPDETSMTLLGQCVYNNNANSIRAMTMQRQLMAMQEQEKATAEYWARWIGANTSQPEHEFRIPLEVTPNGNTPAPGMEEKK